MAVECGGYLVDPVKAWCPSSDSLELKWTEVKMCMLVNPLCSGAEDAGVVDVKGTKAEPGGSE